MKKLAMTVSLSLLVACSAMAQASGSYSYNDQGAAEQCILQSGGKIDGGFQCSQSSTCTESGACLSNADCGVGGTCDLNTSLCVVCTTTAKTGVCGGNFVAGIKGNGGNGNIFVIEPSAVIGLLTDVSLQKSSTLDVGTSSALAGVDFTVTATDGDGAVINPVPNFPVTYDSRFVQISSNLFNMLGNVCTTGCTTAAQCQTGDTCVAGQCTNPITGGVVGNLGCFFNFNESTVSAHSFQWLLPEDGTSGTYTVKAEWAASLGNTGISTSLTCVGPVNVTVQQNKVYHFNHVNVSTSP
jgi:hypothetical protein